MELNHLPVASYVWGKAAGKRNDPTHLRLLQLTVVTSTLYSINDP